MKALGSGLIVVSADSSSPEKKVSKKSKCSSLKVTYGIDLARKISVAGMRRIQRKFRQTSELFVQTLPTSRDKRNNYCDSRYNDAIILIQIIDGINIKSNVVIRHLM